MRLKASKCLHSALKSTNRAYCVAVGTALALEREQPLLRAVWILRVRV